MRTIKRILPARYCSIDDLITYSPLPTPEVIHIDPFLALNHLGPQRYIPENNGLPFYPHSVKGINIVTIVLAGETVFEDSNENKSLVKAGGFHWLNAGNGLRLYEGSSPEFTEKGGKLEMLQLWINQPAGSQYKKSAHLAIQKDKIPLIEKDNGSVTLRILTGEFAGCSGAVNSHDTTTVLINLAPGGQVNLSIPTDRSILFYVILGSVKVNDQMVNKRNLVEFHNDDDLVSVQAEKGSQVLIAFARPVGDRSEQTASNLLQIRENQQMCRDFYRGRTGLT